MKGLNIMRSLLAGCFSVSILNAAEIVLQNGLDGYSGCTESYAFVKDSVGSTALFGLADTMVLRH